MVATAIVTIYLALAPGWVQSPEVHDFYAKQKLLQDRGRIALAREQARQSAGFCPKAETSLDINTCLSAELDKTQKNYTEFVLALGGLLRLPGQDALAQTPKRFTFDGGESAWLIYRDKTCQSVYETWGGGSGGPGALLSCKSELTGNHMKELYSIYENEWH